jgi:hypothetical protein
LWDKLTKVISVIAASTPPAPLDIPCLSPTHSKSL